MIPIVSKLHQKYYEEKLHAKQRFNERYFEKHKSEYDIAQFKDKYLGQECFVVCNGPSLKAEDLDKIAEKGIVSFAANRVFNIYPKTKWRPEYISVADEGYVYEKDIIDGIEQSQPEMFFVRSQAAYTLRKLKCNVCPIFTDGATSLLENPMFSDDLRKVIYAIGPVTYFNIQIAAYMGFKKIYIIGADHKYSNTRNKDGSITKNDGIESYFAEIGENGEKKKITIPQASPTWQIDIAYESALNYCINNGIEIYNATRGGFLEIFKRISFDEIV